MPSKKREEEKPAAFNIYVSTYHLQENRHRRASEKLYVSVVRLKGDNSEFVVLAREVLIHGSSKLVHNDGNPLPYSQERTVAWIETDSEVSVRLDAKDPKLQKLGLDGGWISLTTELFEKLKESHVPRTGC